MSKLLQSRYNVVINLSSLLIDYDLSLPKTVFLGFTLTGIIRSSQTLFKVLDVNLAIFRLVFRIESVSFFFSRPLSEFGKNSYTYEKKTGLDYRGLLATFFVLQGTKKNVLNQQTS